MKGPVLLSACVALVAIGCGDDEPATTAPDSSALVTYARSGGIASMPESLVVRNDGSATVEAGVKGAREEFVLDADELETLRSELEAADFDEIALPPGPTGCADCYVYEVAYGSETISYDDSVGAAIPASVSAVVSRLSEITADHYPRQATEPPVVN